MFDFLSIGTRSNKKGNLEIYPRFRLYSHNKKISDLMIRGGDFYAVWLEDQNLWSTDEQDALERIDRELDAYYNENKSKFDGSVKVLHMWDAESGMIDTWHKYCQRQMRDNFHTLDETLIFSNMETTKKDYASKRLSYPLEEGDISAYGKLMSVLYSPEERQKIEWAIGSIVTGDSKKLQKFVVLYGAAGTGKSTVLNIIQQLFDGYYEVFDAKALGSSSNAFALEAFKSNPLVAIQHDGDLSRIEDNTRLNSLVSHEQMTVNEKFKSTYSTRFKSFLFMGTNKPVRITDAKSGLIRRLIDVTPSGNKVPTREYKQLVKQIGFELGAIACHCRNVYLENTDAYDDYIPITMLGASNDMYNFILDQYLIYSKEDGVTLKAAWEQYKAYCEDARVPYPLQYRVFKEELKNYFWSYEDRGALKDGTRVRSYYSGFRTDKFEDEDEAQPENPTPSWLQFNCSESIFDKECGDCAAQYATSKETPGKKWENVSTTLSDLKTSRVHFVRLPENHIVIDFDIPDKDGHKSLAANLEAASKWPPTYAELSKSGAGIHLHYIYSGDANQLSRLYDDHIEVKVFTGLSSLRRKLSKCNDIPIATLSSGLPLREVKNTVVNQDVVKSEKRLRRQIKSALNKEVHADTTSNVNFINHLLEEAYESGMEYDVSDMHTPILAFAARSTHQSAYCVNLVSKMHFKSEVASDAKQETDSEGLIFYDVEVFPNLLLINWKAQLPSKTVVRMINPSPEEVEDLMKFKLVGFNCRRYDNHILYARAFLHYSNEQLYKLSQRIVNGDKNAFFREAYNVSYTDVYDFSSKKQSLKKFEIELGIHHQELGLPWDQPVPEEKWQKVAEYCDNDVIATEAVFNARKADFTAREILADVAGMTVNDTTNTLTTRIIFGKNRHPQDKFNYRFMGCQEPDIDDCPFELSNEDYEVFDEYGRPLFPGYKFENGKSTYRGEEVGEGGYVYSEPKIYYRVGLCDVVSQHPTSLVDENLLGDEYTARFKDILDARIAIKRGDFEKAGKMLGGKLAKYLTDENAAKDLAQALKIAINSVYGLTAANFDNPFRDPRNVDNIVAKRGALFMINLKHAVQARGFTVAHIKTDSIKIPDATPEIIQFVVDYGKKYGYNFEHEATYDRMCLVNDAVYIAKYADPDWCKNTYGYVPGDNKKHPNEWTATGTQFQVPYVFKTLFSKEPIQFADMCETKSVKTAIYIDRTPEEAAAYISNPDMATDADDILLDNGHSLRFVGKVGLFTPVKEGCGGGTLVRQGADKDGNTKYDSVTGSKGYLWMESEMVQLLGKEDCIDKSYYTKMVDDAVEAISQYGDFERFVSDEPYISPWEAEEPPWDETTPFDVR